MEDIIKEAHPLEPFLPENAVIIILGSFPPKRERWSMEFFYPNFQNDMWRIMGIAFFGDKEKFVIPGHKAFDKDAVADFCRNKGIALYDTASEIVRIKDNASDKFLEVVKATDIAELLGRIPQCRAVIVTGEKAADTFASQMGCDVPAVGGSERFVIGDRQRLSTDGSLSSTVDRELTLYRLPSTSRAYPKPLTEKAEAYKKTFGEIGIL